ncbi:unnamed protein product, partial [Meganyctiphanes norvegica]
MLNRTEEEISDFPPFNISGKKHKLIYNETFPTPNNYTIRIFAENKHNIPFGPINDTIELVVQNKVVDFWIVEPSEKIYVIPKQYSTIIFKDPSNSSFPTDASVVIEWGDGIREIKPFTAESHLIVNHQYMVSQIFEVVATIYNAVSNVTI